MPETRSVFFRDEVTPKPVEDAPERERGLLELDPPREVVALEPDPARRDRDDEGDRVPDPRDAAALAPGRGVTAPSPERDVLALSLDLDVASFRREVDVEAFPRVLDADAFPRGLDDRRRRVEASPAEPMVLDLELRPEGEPAFRAVVVREPLPLRPSTNAGAPDIAPASSESCHGDSAGSALSAGPSDSTGPDLSAGSDDSAGPVLPTGSSDLELPLPPLVPLLRDVLLAISCSPFLPESATPEND